jgi:radical SAM superfamily enzyme YgiQ (UPF0313 family)
MLDMLIAVVPKINPDAPTVGPAVLKSHLIAEGFTCEVVDFNVKLFTELKKKGKENYYFKDDHVFATRVEGKPGVYPKVDPEFITLAKEFEYVFLDWIEFIKEKNPKFLGLSLLSYFSVSVAMKISELVREHLPHIKIVWGGGGLEYGIWKFKEMNLIDHYINGDGENSIVELLKGNLSYSGIDKWESNQVRDLNSVLLPNYDDINWEEYHQVDWKKTVYITGSRGCVKRCTFCNVYEMWPDYLFRSGKSIANEIIFVKEKYDRYNFKFTDSLINGSMKAFNSLLDELIEYRKINLNFNWQSQWIIRSKSLIPENDFKHYTRIKNSGCNWLDVGLESFSQHVRFHMGKKITDTDIWWCLELLNKFEISHVLLMIVGYPTETEEDHQHTLQSVRKIFELGWDKHTYFSFGNTLMLDQSQPLYKLIEDDLEYHHSAIDWKYKDNDLSTRIRRFNEVNNLIKELKNVKELSWMSEKALINYDKKSKGEFNKKWNG